MPTDCCLSAVSGAGGVGTAILAEAVTKGGKEVCMVGTVWERVQGSLEGVFEDIRGHVEVVSERFDGHL